MPDAGRQTPDAELDQQSKTARVSVVPKHMSHAAARSPVPQHIPRRSTSAPQYVSFRLESLVSRLGLHPSARLESIGSA